MAYKVGRTVFSEFQNELSNDKILILTGPRQSGKTTILKKLSEILQEKEESSKGRQIFYYNFDRTADLDFFNKQQKVEAFLKIRSLKQRIYVFIDEVQRKKDAGTFFKYFYDAGLNVKFIFSGSSSTELLDNFGDALTGRKRTYKLYPLSINELAENTLGEEEFKYAGMGEPNSLEQLALIVTQTLIWGGYPEVNQANDFPEKSRALGELYESYVQQDVKDLLRVKNISGFNLLVKYLAHNVGGQLIVEELVRNTGLHTNTTNSYLDILIGTMIIGTTSNYNPNFDDKLPKSDHYYFVDNGMRNYALQQLQSDFRPDEEILAKNLIFGELLKLQEYNQAKLPFQIHHYETYSGNFIDFIITKQSTQKILPVVVRYQNSSEKVGKKIHEFINSHNPDQLVIVVSDESIDKIKNPEMEIKDCMVKFVGLSQFLAQVLVMIRER